MAKPDERGVNGGMFEVGYLPNMPLGNFNATIRLCNSKVLFD